MFHELRRKDKAMSDSMKQELLQKGEYGVLSTLSKNGYTYGVPLSYACLDDAVYIHCALQGHKLENIKHHSKVSFCIVNQAETLAEQFSVRFRSVILFGEASVVDDEDEKDRALIALLEKYSSNFMDEGRQYIAKQKNRTEVVKITIKYITGKAKL